MAGKISRSPFKERVENTPWPSFPSVIDIQDFITQKVDRLCILGVRKQQQGLPERFLHL
jgi:hypothetical protein